MSGAHHCFDLQGAALELTGAGALWWPDQALLCVSDLHLGRSERYARRAGALLPPYEVEDTLLRLDQEIERLAPRTVVCLGDSFDDRAASEGLAETARGWLTRLMAGRRWVWIEGNHDPGPTRLGGEHLAEHTSGPLTFRHIAVQGASGEVSGHYHPKAQVSGRGRARPAALYDEARLILPAFGTYTGGLRAQDPAIDPLFGPRAVAVLIGPRLIAIPKPR